MQLWERLKVLGIVLPDPPEPAGAYVRAKREGRLFFVAGQLPLVEGRLVAKGRVPTDVSEEAAAAAARQCALNALAIAVAEGGEAGVVGVVYVRGYVACEPGFERIPALFAPASELFKQVFGQEGAHARMVLGVSALPLGSPVALEVVFRLAAG